MLSRNITCRLYQRVGHATFLSNDLPKAVQHSKSQSFFFFLTTGSFWFQSAKTVPTDRAILKFMTNLSFSIFNLFTRFVDETKQSIQDNNFSRVFTVFFNFFY